jgi:toxin ParE1/3/4
MLRIVRTSQAQEDVLDMWQFIAADSIEAADALVRRLDEVVRLLSEHPRLGMPEDKYRIGLRCMPVGNYLIFYEETPDALRILRVLHGARRWEELIQ